MKDGRIVCLSAVCSWIGLVWRPLMRFGTRLLLMFVLGYAFPAQAQNALNTKGDNIVGTYRGVQKNDKFKVKVTRQSNGTYRAQIFWVEHDTDSDGKKILDGNNPDKSLRSTPCDRIVLFAGLKYNERDRCWDGTKIYDPHRGVKAKMKAWFADDGRLCVKGTLLAFSETVYWERLR